MRDKQVFIYSNACDRRSIDAKKICKYFSKNNYRIVEDPKEADYIVFFTCAFVNKTAERCLDIIKKLKKYDAELIVAGCLPEIANEKLKEIFDGKTLSTKDMDKVDDIFKENRIKFKDIEDEHALWHNFNPIGLSKQPAEIAKKILSKSRLSNKIYRYFTDDVLKKFFSDVPPFSAFYPAEDRCYTISIARGCIHKCSYCAIRGAIGSLKSKPIYQIIKEFEDGLDQGYTDFVLEADDLGPYGIDIDTNLSELLDEMTKIDRDYNLTLKNTHPVWIIKYIESLEEILKRKKIKSIILAIQSGSNRILKLMRRSHTREALIDAISRMKDAYPGLNIRTLFIVGFPSETTDEFIETLDLIKNIHTSGGRIYSFSCMDGTDANAIDPKVAKKEMRRRMRISFKFLKKMEYLTWYTESFRGICFDKD